MRLGLKEIRYNRKKYLLVELILTLLIFMVLFLSGLANGLGRAVSAAIENMPAETFLLSCDAENLLSLSELSADQYDSLVDQYGNNFAGLSIFRSNVNETGSEEKENIVYFGIDAENFLNPEIVEGKGLSGKEHEIVLDSSFKSAGMKLGDTIEDASARYEYTIVGFTEDAMYSHVAVGYISQNTFEALRQSSIPAYTLSYNAIAVQNLTDIEPEGMTLMAKADVIDNLPGYTAEQMTIRMILWVLVVISAVILGIFFFILTLQKQNQFGVLKAIGMKMSEINGMLIAQILLLSLCGACLGNLLAFLMAAFLPDSMPFYLQVSDAGTVSVAFIGISLIFGLCSTRRIAKVDPLMTIGGMENE